MDFDSSFRPSKDVLGLVSLLKNLSKIFIRVLVSFMIICSVHA